MGYMGVGGYEYDESGIRGIGLGLCCAPVKEVVTADLGIDIWIFSSSILFDARRSGFFRCSDSCIM
jgi:hypothetical protein